MKKYILLYSITILVMVAIVFATSFFDVFGDETGVHVRIEPDKREFVKSVAKKVSGVIYREATEHNPKGDILPDEIDDRIKGEIKERF